jgi:hypothetical protein
MALQHNLTQLIDEPTRKKNKLDLIFINNTSSVTNCGLQQIAMSDHDLIYCDLNFQKPVLMKKSFKWRNIKYMDKDLTIRQIVSNISTINTRNPHNFTELILQSILHAFDELAPVKNVSFVPYLKATYIAKTTNDTMKLRDDVKRVSDKFPYNNELRVRLKELQMKVKKMIKADTKSDLDRKIHANGNQKTHCGSLSRN